MPSLIFLLSRMALWLPAIKRLPYLYPRHLPLILPLPLVVHKKAPAVSKNRNHRWIIKADWFQLALPARRYRCPHLHIRILLPNRSRTVHPADIGTLYYVFLNIAHFRTCAAPGTYCHLSYCGHIECSFGWKNPNYYLYPEKCSQLHVLSF